ncbi:ionotropic receptor 21a-like [Panulirus ornatus]|uniref:ionotropic receptor 21a-like n=1 Tax=Panulirus ornatus TaxID=150431 RepID=UPI003A879E74
MSLGENTTSLFEHNTPLRENATSLGEHTISLGENTIPLGGVVAEVRSLFFLDQSSQERFLEGVWGDVRFPCRALILHLTNNQLAIRFFEVSSLWQRPETRVVIVGGKSDMEALLYHSSLRNTVHLLYLAADIHKNLTVTTRLRTRPSSRGWSDHINIYRRCLYCGNGEVDVQLLQRWHPSRVLQDLKSIFTEKLESFMGHRFKIMAVHANYISRFQRDSQSPGTTMTPVDSLDVRMLKAFAAHANFTYQVWEPRDRQWGLQIENGSWTGTVSVLQDQQADFSLLLTLTSSRMQAVQFSAIYLRTTIVILSLKPKLLPQHMAIIRPFPGILWLVLTVTILLWAIALWLIQITRTWMLGSGGAQLSSTLLYSWGVLMENWTPYLPAKLTGRLLPGLLLVSCLILNTAYRSSLVAHLIVQDKDAEINTFHDLLARDGWQWGTERIGDVLIVYFQNSPNPEVKRISKELQMILKIPYASQTEDILYKA